MAKRRLWYILLPDGRTESLYQRRSAWSAQAPWMRGKRSGDLVGQLCWRYEGSSEQHIEEDVRYWPNRAPKCRSVPEEQMRLWD